MKKQQESLEDELYIIGGILFIVFCVLGILYFSFLKRFLPDVPCFFSAFLGFYCPGCGGTRAFEALLKGKVFLSLWYHPFVIYFVVTYTGFMLSHTFSRISKGKVHGWKFHMWYLSIGVIIILVNFFSKNFLRLRFGIGLDISLLIQ